MLSEILNTAIQLAQGAAVAGLMILAIDLVAMEVKSWR